MLSCNAPFNVPWYWHSSPHGREGLSDSSKQDQNDNQDSQQIHNNNNDSEDSQQIHSHSSDCCTSGENEGSLVRADRSLEDNGRRSDRSLEDHGRRSDRSLEDHVRRSDRSLEDNGRRSNRSLEDNGRRSDRSLEDHGRRSDRSLEVNGRRSTSKINDDENNCDVNSKVADNNSDIIEINGKLSGTNGTLDLPRIIDNHENSSRNCFAYNNGHLFVNSITMWPELKQRSTEDVSMLESHIDYVNPLGLVKQSMDSATSLDKSVIYQDHERKIPTANSYFTETESAQKFVIPATAHIDIQENSLTNEEMHRNVHFRPGSNVHFQPGSNVHFRPDRNVNLFKNITPYEVAKFSYYDKTGRVKLSNSTSTNENMIYDNSNSRAVSAFRQVLPEPNMQDRGRFHTEHGMCRTSYEISPSGVNQTDWDRRRAFGERRHRGAQMTGVDRRLMVEGKLAGEPGTHKEPSTIRHRGVVVAMTSQPGSQSEMQLYRVLQRANLLSYYDTFIAQGGDDVQQLCEAGEDEFLEIMALVGMASKPLHVRRLQKILQEWVTNPAAFLTPERASTTPTPGSISATAQQQGYTVHSTSHSNNNTSWSGSSSVSPSALDAQDTKPPRLSASPSLMPSSLADEQISAIAAAAERLARNLPMFPPKDLNPKKGFNREVMEVMLLTEDDVDRLDKLRKYAAIYGRFDSKRKNDRPMSLHELSVNEASAQLCRFVPALLSRREDLFPLARQVVRDSGYQYSKGHSSAHSTTANKRLKLDNSFNSWLIDQLQKPTRTDLNGNKEHQIKEISGEIKDLRDKMETVRSLIQEAKERSDTEALTVLKGRIDNLTTRQLTLLAELEEFTALPDSAPKSARSANGCDDDELSDSSNAPSGASSPVPVADSSLSRRLVVASQLRGQNGGSLSTENEVNLFEEGLRIAQQYGLADFAEELKELRQKTGEEDSSHEAGVNTDDDAESRTTNEAGFSAARRNPDRTSESGSEAVAKISGPRQPSQSEGVERSMDRSAERSTERSMERSMDRSVERSMDQSTDRSTERSTDRSVERSTDAPSVAREGGVHEAETCENRVDNLSATDLSSDVCDREVEMQNLGDEDGEHAQRVSRDRGDCGPERQVSSSSPHIMTQATHHVVQNLSPTSISIHSMNTRKVRRPSQQANM